MLGSNGCGLACSLVNTNLLRQVSRLAIYFAALALSSCSNHDCDRIQSQRVLYIYYLKDHKYSLTECVTVIKYESKFLKADTSIIYGGAARQGGARAP